MYKAIPTGMALRMRRDCTERAEFQAAWRKYIELFCRRGDATKDVHTAFHRARKAKCSQILVREDRGKKSDNKWKGRLLFPHGTAMNLKERLELAAHAFNNVGTLRPAVDVPRQVVYRCGRNLKSHLIGADADLKPAIQVLRPRPQHVLRSEPGGKSHLPARPAQVVAVFAPGPFLWLHREP